MKTCFNPHNQVVQVVAGESRAAYERGVALSLDDWEAHVPALADIVFSRGYPAENEFWQANKGLYETKRMIKREGGDIILVTPFPEWLSSQPEHVAALPLRGVSRRACSAVKLVGKDWIVMKLLALAIL